MSKRKSKRVHGQVTRAKPKSAAQFFAQPIRAQESTNKTAHVLSQMRAEGSSLRKAARENAVSPQTVRRYAGSALRRGATGRYKAQPRDSILRVLVIPTPGGLAEIATRDSRAATMVAEYWNAVQLFLQTGDDSDLRPFRGKFITDAQGNQICFLTDLDELERLGSAGVLSFESLYARAS